MSDKIIDKVIDIFPNYYKKYIIFGLPWQSVFKTVSFHHKGTKFNPSWGTKIWHVAWHGQRKNFFKEERNM